MKTANCKNLTLNDTKPNFNDHVAQLQETPERDCLLPAFQSLSQLECFVDVNNDINKTESSDSPCRRQLTKSEAKKLNTERYINKWQINSDQGTNSVGSSEAKSTAYSKSLEKHEKYKPVKKSTIEKHITQVKSVEMGMSSADTEKSVHTYRKEMSGPDAPVLDVCNKSGTMCRSIDTLHDSECDTKFDEDDDNASETYQRLTVRALLKKYERLAEESNLSQQHQEQQLPLKPQQKSQSAQSIIASRANLPAEPSTPEEWKNAEARYDQLQKQKMILEGQLSRLPSRSSVEKVAVNKEEEFLANQLSRVDRELSALRLLMRKHFSQTRIQLKAKH
ncbi:unnamed protein product [Echinostoma caproni]|uniref:Protein Shroom2 n=1 Tax=Echinostoma caproni TaxID=27848 RepID=A0A183AAQ9_9TREM|nr:unnamed protein product [Echinostoma caproni]